MEENGVTKLRKDELNRSKKLTVVMKKNLQYEKKLKPIKRKMNICIT